MPKTRVLLTTFNVDVPFDLAFSLAPKYLKFYALKDKKLARSLEIDINEYKLSDDNVLLLSRIAQLKPHVIGFSCYMWNIERTLAVASDIKQISNATIVLGGPEAGPTADEILKKNPCIDLIVRDEGEETFTRLLESIVDKKSLKHVHGLTYRMGGKIVHNIDRKPIEKLEYLPSINSNIDDPLERKVIFLEGSRGCINNCHFCDFHRSTHKLRLFSLERIKEELSMLLKKRLWYIHWTDSIFNVNLKRAKEICRFIIDNNQNNVQSQVSIDPSNVDEELSKLFHMAKMNILDIGIQSTDPRVLEDSGRKTDFAKIKRGLKLLKKYSLSLVMHLIFGLPGDNLAKFRRSLKQTFAMKPDGISIFRLHVLPGTKIWERAGTLGIQYEASPPYQIIQSGTISLKDILKFERIKRSIYIFLETKVTKLLCKDIDFDLVDLVESWIDFVGNDEMLLSMKLNREFAVKLIGFIRHLAAKNPKINLAFYSAIISREFDLASKSGNTCCIRTS